MKCLLLGFIFLITFLSCWANIAEPYGVPSAAGDILIGEQEQSLLRIEKELLILDLTANSKDSASCSATYYVLNLEKQSVDIKLLFLTPDAENISIAVNDQIVAVINKEISAKDIPWVRETDLPVEYIIYVVKEFEVHFDPEEEKTIEVRFNLKPGWHNMAVSHGPTAPQASHWLNLIKDGEHVSWYVYDLFAAKTFKGGFGELQFILKIPENTDLICNLPVNKNSAPAGEKAQIFTGNYNGLPKPMVDLKIIFREEYNFIGVTLGYYGCAFPLDGRPVNWLIFSGSLDLYLENHQLSLGIEGDPVNNACSLYLIYTLFPPGRTGNSYGLLFDIRGGGGILLDIINSYSVGFRVYIGFKLFLPAYEFYYDFYPFTDDGSFRHNLGIRGIFAL